MQFYIRSAELDGAHLTVLYEVDGGADFYVTVDIGNAPERVIPDVVKHAIVQHYAKMKKLQEIANMLEGLRWEN